MALDIEEILSHLITERSLIIIGSLSLIGFMSCRLADALFHAMLLWYYSTLTLQEHILIANGSR